MCPLQSRTNSEKSAAAVAASAADVDVDINLEPNSRKKKKKEQDCYDAGQYMWPGMQTWVDGDNLGRPASRFVRAACVRTGPVGICRLHNRQMPTWPAPMTFLCRNWPQTFDINKDNND